MYTPQLRRLTVSSLFIAASMVWSCSNPSPQAPDADAPVQRVGYTPLEPAGIAYAWEHISSTKNQIATPNGGNQQTATLVVDADGDGLNDFFIAERTNAPALVWYRRTSSGWDRYIVEKEPLRIEAGSAFADIDGDGDIDVVFGGDAQSEQVWWWENPYPDYDSTRG